MRFTAKTAKLLAMSLFAAPPRRRLTFRSAVELLERREVPTVVDAFWNPQGASTDANLASNYESVAGVRNITALNTNTVLHFGEHSSTTATLSGDLHVDALYNMTTAGSCIIQLEGHTLECDGSVNSFLYGGAVFFTSSTSPSHLTFDNGGGTLYWKGTDDFDGGSQLGFFTISCPAVVGNNTAKLAMADELDVYGSDVGFSYDYGLELGSTGKMVVESGASVQFNPDNHDQDWSSSATTFTPYQF